MRRRLFSHGFKVERVQDENDDTQEWLYHQHDDCYIYCPYHERDYEGGFDDTDDDDPSSNADNSCVVS